MSFSGHYQLCFSTCENIRKCIRNIKDRNVAERWSCRWRSKSSLASRCYVVSDAFFRSNSSFGSLLWLWHTDLEKHITYTISPSARVFSQQWDLILFTIDYRQISVQRNTSLQSHGRAVRMPLYKTSFEIQQLVNAALGKAMRIFGSGQDFENHTCRS